jgi:hypothetical protein
MSDLNILWNLLAIADYITPQNIPVISDVGLALWRRNGRPRKDNVEPYPSGRIKRAKDGSAIIYQDTLAPTLVRRMLDDEMKRCSDPRFSSQPGRLYLRGGLLAAEYQAGLKFAEIYHRVATNNGSRRSAKSPNCEIESRGASERRIGTEVRDSAEETHEDATPYEGFVRWSDYRPAEKPTFLQIEHAKTGAKIWHPLEDDDGNLHLLYPEAEAVLAQVPRRGLSLILRRVPPPRRRKEAPEAPPPDVFKPTMPWRWLALFAKCALRALPAWFTLDSCRHGGMTEIESAGLTRRPGARPLGALLEGL